MAPTLVASFSLGEALAKEMGVTPTLPAFIPLQANRLSGVSAMVC